jgi:hypothetical protein
MRVTKMDWLKWLSLTDCICPYAWRNTLGKLYGIYFMGGWVRLSDAPGCPCHKGKA